MPSLLAVVETDDDGGVGDHSLRFIQHLQSASNHVDVPAAYSCSGLLDSFAVVAFLFGECGYEKI
jgi:hypothetical protein